MKKLNLWAILLVALVAFASCTSSSKPLAGHVIYIGLDGWGSYSVDKHRKQRRSRLQNM